MYCKKCGNLVDDDSKHCKFCGEKLSVETNIKKQNLFFSCPICNEIDRVAKVSSIYSSGTSTTSYSGSAISFSIPFSSKESSSLSYTPFSVDSNTVSDLSKKLAPPPEPRKKSSGCLFAFLIYLLIGLIPWGIVMPCIFLSEKDKIISLIIIPPIVSFTISFLIIRFIIKRRRYLNLSYETEIENYEKLIPRWQKLYYCFRDDVVFNPENKKLTSADQINKMIYEDF
jgi:hypothetical protein